MSQAVARTDDRAVPRSERTRAAILAAAEALFAERGFAETRLEDVAEAVGIRRASIVYYFADKPALYDAVLADVFGSLRDRLAPALLAPKPLADRALDAVSIWIDTLAERPSTARILLREVADGRTGQEPPVVKHTRAFFELIGQALAKSGGDVLAHAEPVHPVHLAAVVTGATVFYIAAMPALLPGLGFDPFEPARLAAFKHELTSTVRRLLGAA
jgi:TetR/AcrR family transcriptional regulator